VPVVFVSKRIVLSRNRCRGSSSFDPIVMPSVRCFAAAFFASVVTFFSDRVWLKAASGFPLTIDQLCVRPFVGGCFCSSRDMRTPAFEDAHDG